ncbi:MerR family transcriptional regulator [Bacillus sp. 1P06AnD]|uniref:MerR family transcriptional regulator n=1 Tax=Bacillus sp. 1P06AnD TaxID=3132208 RepID=UPI0039A1C67A
MKQRFTIGETAKLHNIPESTLRYYDQKGIFQPKMVDPQTKYRYYTIDQFSMIEIIKFLRHLDIPLDEIKQFAERRNPASAMALLKKHTIELQKREKEIQAMMSMIQQKMNMIQEGLEIESNKVTFTYLSKRPIRFMKVDRFVSDDEFTMHLNQLQKESHIDTPALLSANIGTFTSLEGLKRGDYLDISGLFISVEEPLEEGVEYTFIPEGEYACMYHKGPYEENKETYQFFLEEIHRQSYEIVGDAIEIGIIDTSVSAEEQEFVTAYQIPVRKK